MWLPYLTVLLKDPRNQEDTKLFEATFEGDELYGVPKILFCYCLCTRYDTKDFTLFVE